MNILLPLLTVLLWTTVRHCVADETPTPSTESTAGTDLQPTQPTTQLQDSTDGPYGPTCDGFDQLRENVNANYMECSRNRQCDTANCNITNPSFSDHTLSMTLLSCQEPRPAVHLIVRDGGNAEVLNTIIDETQNGIDLGQGVTLDVTLDHLDEAIGLEAILRIDLVIFTQSDTLVSYTIITLDRRSCTTEGTTESATTDSPTTATDSTTESDSPTTATDSTTESATTDSPTTATDSTTESDSPTTATDSTTEGATTESPTTATDSTTESDSPTTATDSTTEGATTDSPTTATDSTTESATTDSPTTATDSTTESATTDSPTTATDSTTESDSPTTATDSTTEGATTDHLTTVFIAPTSVSIGVPTTEGLTAIPKVTPTQTPTLENSTCAVLSRLASSAEFFECVSDTTPPCQTVWCTNSLAGKDYSAVIVLVPCVTPAAVRLVMSEEGKVLLNKTIDHSQEITIPELFGLILIVTLDQFQDAIGLQVDAKLSTEMFSIVKYTVIPLERAKCVKNGSGAVDAKTSENSGVMATAPIIPSILLSLVALLTAYISCAC